MHVCSIQITCYKINRICHVCCADCELATWSSVGEHADLVCCFCQAVGQKQTCEHQPFAYKHDHLFPACLMCSAVWNGCWSHCQHQVKSPHPSGPFSVKYLQNKTCIWVSEVLQIQQSNIRGEECEKHFETNLKQLVEVMNKMFILHQNQLSGAWTSQLCFYSALFWSSQCVWFCLKHKDLQWQNNIFFISSEDFVFCFSAADDKISAHKPSPQHTDD